MSNWMEALKKEIPDHQIMTGIADRYSYSFDASFGEHLPDAAIQAKSKQEVVHIVKVANQFNIPIYPRGQGTCLSGGPLPVCGGIVLDLSQWPEQIDMNADDLTVQVSPSVLTARINEEAEKHGLMYAPDPSSAHVATIGGNLAENSGGPRGLKYGVTKDFVLGLELVTPEGEVIRTGGQTIKNVTGFDLTKLIVGSEGTLGVITEATLKLVPKPPAVQTIMVEFNDVRTAGKAISRTLTSGILPSKMEFMDQACIQAVENFKPSGLPVDAEAIVIIELDGHLETLNVETILVENIMLEIGAANVSIPATSENAARIWHARKQVSPAIAKIKPTKVSEDATVPRSKIPDMMDRLHIIKEKYQVEVVVFGHAGDGNLHPNILCDKRDQEEMARVEQAVEEIFQAAIDLGGTLSGEHGIGTMKAPFMEQELGTVGLEMMKRIKDSWDPKGIMNPGKIFPEKGQKLVLRNG
ncbi:putative FAD-linked oxidoreductase [Halobacillus karajensis]|uniref:FAD-linked oxidoreductase n=2 Tax=Halobacillus karajensis TaxID=195088 RepID=A0A024P534_9BACI|nr:FAD-linked oxidase C-terminal domain-containing protein [Halobacillus karajensis]CDQ20789.1 putative FAD-linked oxidoreductase [Halobacillus karajensis]CDQ23741.1 putative FAD-linked oxidoreductase [Halobacillus karajensis]CDQ27219.1 putative FAD-linked oxidoreductase [Halobacillus karajensis]